MNQRMPFAVHKLIEEMGELQQVLGKLMAFPEGPHPDGGPPLQQRLAEESIDVLAALTYFMEKFGFNDTTVFDEATIEALKDRLDDKYEKFVQWGKLHDKSPEEV